jgi:hypothetical protein
VILSGDTHANVSQDQRRTKTGTAPRAGHVWLRGKSEAVSRLVASWLSHNAQTRTQQLVEHRTRRQQLYQTLIEGASPLYGLAPRSAISSAFTRIARMRLSGPAVVRHAEAVVAAIIDIVAEPVKSSLRDLIHVQGVRTLRATLDWSCGLWRPAAAVHSVPSLGCP